MLPSARDIEDGRLAKSSLAYFYDYSSSTDVMISLLSVGGIQVRFRT
jgi:hypothetical protein